MGRPKLWPSTEREGAQPQSWFREHSLSIFLVTLLLVQTVAYWFAELPDWRETQRALELSTSLWPGYALHFVAEYLVSIVADTYGALLLVLASKWFFERGSAESKDDDGARGSAAAPS
ncbi:MAG TPA: hypothetical protein VLA82_01135 [Actinomycetota bacterium]|nr:hypothetical protein [Actinomycetota bacterium]